MHQVPCLIASPPALDRPRVTRAVQLSAAVLLGLIVGSWLSGPAAVSRSKADDDNLPADAYTASVARLKQANIDLRRELDHLSHLLHKPIGSR
ncbi:MAG TPA: hypothetical protein VG944_10395 [Fimbriimonas sp.]|nr:hypothetical protein [Fimbriimonas sp.]